MPGENTVLADERRKPPLPLPSRPDLMGSVAAASLPGDHPSVAGAARVLEPLRKVAAELSQVVNRAADETRRFGAPLPPDSKAHAESLDFCDRQARTLEVAAAAACGMVEHVRSQFPGYEPPAPRKPRARKQRTVAEPAVPPEPAEMPAPYFEGHPESPGPWGPES